MNETLQKQKALIDAGYSDEEISQWQAEQRQALSDAGFNQAEIDTEFGNPPLDPAPVAKAFDESLKKATAPETPDGQPRPVKDFKDAFMAGLTGSVSGLLVEGKKPDTVLSEDAPMISRFAANIGALAGDAPFYGAGALVGGSGGPVTAMAGAMGLTEGIRAVIMDKYEKGEASTFGEIMERSADALIKTGKGYVVGAVTGLAGKAAGFLPIASPTAKAAATVASEVTAMVTASKALEGEVPTANDFIDAAVVVGGVKGAVKAAGKVREIYAKTGVKPDDLVADMERDVTIGQDMLSENVAIPRTYGKVTATFESPERGVVPVEEVKPSKTVDEQIKDVADELGQPVPEPKPLTLKDAQQKILSKISIGEHTDKEPMTWQKLYTNVVDNLNPFREAVKQATKNKEELPTVDDPYQLARLTRGVFGKATQFLEYGTYDFKTYDNNGASLKAILQKGAGRDLPEITSPEKVDLNGFRAYIASRRTVELAARGIEPGFDVEAAKVVVKEGKHFEAVARELTNYQNRLTKYLKDAGVISEDAHKAMMDANKEYVPFFRVMDDESGGFGFNRGGGGSPIKKIKGSDRHTIDPIESVIKNTYLYVAMAEHNAVGLKFIEMANKSGAPETFYRKVPQKIQATTLRENEIKALFDEFVTVRKQTSTERTTATKSASESKSETIGGEDAAPQSKQGKIVRDRVFEALSARGFSKGEAEQMIARLEAKSGGGTTMTESKTTVETLIKEIEKTEYIPEIDIRLPHEVATIFRAIKEPLRDNEIAVFENGKRNVYEVDKDLAEAFKAADGETAGLLMKVFTLPARTLRAGAVLSPDFIFRNIIRDQQMAFLLSKAGYIPMLDFMRGLASLAKKDTDFQNFLKSGGANATIVAMDRQYLQDHMKSLLANKTVMEKSWNVVKSPLHILQILTELAENSTRLGEFKRVSGGLTEKAAIQEGGFAARELTDFARHGAKTRALSMLSAFWNASLQGEDRMYRGLAEKPFETSAKAFAAITLPSILLWLNNKDDPRWKDIPRWQKDTMWIVMTKDHIYRIPKAHSAGILFGSIPERMLEAWSEENPKAFKDLEASILSNFIPVPMPTTPAPVVEQFANRSTFTDQPLIPSDVEGLLPEYQYTQYTTELAKQLGATMAAFPGMRDRSLERGPIAGVARALTSPILIENYVRAWTGGLGMYVLQTADKALREAGVLPDPIKPLSTLDDIPIVKAFTIRYPTATAQSIQDFNDQYFKEKRYYDSWIRKLEDSDVAAAARIRAMAPAAWDEAADLRRVIGDLGKYIRDVYGNPQFSESDKQQLIDTAYFQMINLSRAGTQMMQDVHDAMDGAIEK